MELSSIQVQDVLCDAPGALAQAAAAVHAPASSVALTAKLASCNLLSNLLLTQELADVALVDMSGKDNGATMLQDMAQSKGQCTVESGCLALQMQTYKLVRGRSQYFAVHKGCLSCPDPCKVLIESF